MRDRIWAIFGSREGPLTYTVVYAPNHPGDDGDLSINELEYLQFHIDEVENDWYKAGKRQQLFTMLTNEL